MRRREKQSRIRRIGFTLVELMIVITILGLLAAIVVPFYKHYVESANAATAQADLQAAQRAVAIYHGQNGSWPATLSPDLFRFGEAPILPDGYTLNYDSATGEVTLASTPPGG